jgi:hypothetical protein
VADEADFFVFNPDKVRNVSGVKRTGRLFHANGRSAIAPKPVIQNVDGQIPEFRDVRWMKKSPTPQKRNATKAVKIPRKCMVTMIAEM